MALTVSSNKNWSDYEATSSTSLAIGSGALTALSLTITTGKAYTAGDDIALVPTAAKIPMMLIGTVTSYDAGTGALVANCTRIESQIPSWDLVSASSNTVGTGAKTFVTYNGKSALLAASDAIMVGRRGTNGGNRMVGTVTSYNNADGTLVTNITSTIGSGTSLTDWIIVSSGTFSAWKIVPSPIASITLLTSANLTFDQEPSYPIGSLVSLDRGRFIFSNASTTTPWVIELGSRNTNSSKIFQLENNGRIDVTGAAIVAKTGDGTASQTLDLSGATYAKIDHPAIEVETGSGTGVYRPWYVMESSATDRGYLGKNFVSRGYKNYFTPATSATVTLTTASPTVITWASHGLRPGNRVRFTTTGTFTGITAGTDYYVLVEGFTTGSFRIGVNAHTNTGVNVTAQSGTHTAYSLAEFGTGLHGNVALWNPTTRILTFGNGTQGNVIPNGAKVRIPNTHFTMEYPRTPIMSAISSATAGNAVTFVVGNVSNIPTSTGMTFFINQEEFTGTITTSTMTTATRNVNGTVAANHAQGDTMYPSASTSATTSVVRGQVDVADGGIVNLSRCSFGNVFVNLSNGQNAVMNNVWVTGSNTIGTTTADVTMNGICSQPHPQGDGATLTVSSILGATSAQNIYAATTAITLNQSSTAITLSNLQNATAISGVEGIITTRNGTAGSNNGVSISAVIANATIQNLASIGGRMLFQNMSRFEVDGITHSDQSSGVISQNVSHTGLTPANCQYAVFRNMVKASGGASVRGNIISTDANCANLVFHSVTYDAASNSNAAISPLGNNLILANSTFGTFPDRGSTGSGTGAMTNTSTGDTVTLRNVVFTHGDTYGADNGNGATARCFLEQTTGHSMWWRAAGTAFDGNYQEMGPFHVLLDNNVKNAGTLACQFSVKASRDIYDLNGGAYLNNGGSVFLPTTGDYIILKSYQNLRTITGFSGTVTPEDVNNANLAYSFEMVGHEGTFTGTYTALTTANLNAAIAAISGYDDAHGFKFRLKITATADSASNQVIQVRMFTTNNASTVLPIGYSEYTMTDLDNPTAFAAFDGVTELDYETVTSGTASLSLPYDFDGLYADAQIKVRCLSCNWDDHALSYNQYAQSRVSLQTPDTEVTVTNAATVAAYTTLETPAKLYDYVKYWGSLRANLTVDKLCTKSGNNLDFGSYDIVLDATAGSPLAKVGNTITIKLSEISVGTITTTGTLTAANGALIKITYTAGGTTYTYATGSVSGFTVGSRIQIFNVTTNTEMYNGVPGSAPYTVNYTNGTGYSTGDSVRVRITYVSGVTAHLPEQYTVVASATGWSVVDDVSIDTIYNALAINGSAVTGFAADYVSDEVNVTIASDWYAADLYAWWCYNLTTSQGISDFFGGMTALDVGNFRINNATVNLYLDNTTSTNLKQLDNRRIYRDDAAYPVKSSGGGGMDVVWRNQILIAETGVSGLTAGESATLTKLDTLTENVSGLRFTAKALEAAPSSSGSGATLAEIEGSTVLAKEATSAAIKAKTDSLPASPAAVGSAMTLTSAYDAAKTAASQASVDAIPTTAAPAAATVANAVRTELATELARVDANVSSRSTYAGADTSGTTTLLTRVTGAVLLASNYTAPLDSTATQAAAAAALSAYDGPTKAELDAAVAPLATTTNLDTLPTLAEMEASAILSKQATTQVAATKASLAAALSA